MPDRPLPCIYIYMYIYIYIYILIFTCIHTYNGVFGGGGAFGDGPLLLDPRK